MKINRIRVYRQTLTYARGSYAWGRGNVITTGQSTIVVVDTDSGLSGCGEFCPCGDNYSHYCARSPDERRAARQQFGGKKV